MRGRLGVAVVAQLSCYPPDRSSATVGQSPLTASRASSNDECHERELQFGFPLKSNGLITRNCDRSGAFAARDEVTAFARP
jgi:hypothetical protein